MNRNKVLVAVASQRRHLSASAGGGLGFLSRPTSTNTQFERSQRRHLYGFGGGGLGFSKEQDNWLSGGNESRFCLGFGRQRRHLYGFGGNELGFLARPVLGGNVLVRKKHSLSRNWFARHWVADEKERREREVLISRFRDRSQKNVEEYEANGIFEDYGGDGVLSPKSPEEAKLAPLLARSDLLITRDIEWANLMFAFEQESRYIIVDPRYPQSPVGSIHERSNVIYRQLLRTRRPFIAHLTDAHGNEIFTIRRPFWWINSTIYAEVNGKEIGVVHRRWHLWRRIYDLYLGKRQFAVVENPGFWNWTFTLKDDDEKVLAEINRDWRGLGLELFTDAGQYVIRFGGTNSRATFSQDANIPELDIARPLSFSERAVAVALAVSLDSDYFSRHGGVGLPIFIAGE